MLGGMTSKIALLQLVGPELMKKVQFAHESA